MESTIKSQKLTELQHKLERIGAFSLIQKIQIEEEIQSILQSIPAAIPKSMPDVPQHSEPEVFQKTIPLRQLRPKSSPKSQEPGKPSTRPNVKNKRIEIQLNLFGN